MSRAPLLIFLMTIVLASAIACEGEPASDPTAAPTSDATATVAAGMTAAAEDANEANTPFTSVSATSTPTAAAATAPPVSPTPTQPALTVTSITSPIAVNSIASLAVQTAPGASCSLSYTTPSGSASEADGLGSAIADGQGVATWSWKIGARTSPGTGQLRVTCAGQSQAMAIVITN